MEELDDFTLYKSLYDRELCRRNDLENSVNIPIVAITLLCGVIYYILSNVDTLPCLCWVLVIHLLIVISTLAIFVSLFFLVSSYNNLFKGFKYLNFPTTIELREYQIKLKEFNATCDPSDKEDFNDYLIEKYVSYTDAHIKINDKRGVDLYRAKTWVVIVMISLLVTSALFLILKFQQ